MSQSKSKKNKASQQNNPQAPETARLEDSLTEVATATSQGLKKHWKTVVAGIVVLALVTVIIQTMQTLAEGKNEDLSGRLYTLSTAASTTPDSVPDLKGFRDLAADAVGAESEKRILRSLVRFLSQRASAYARRAATPPPAVSTEEEKTEPEFDPAQAKKDIDALVREIATGAKDRFAGDEEMSTWVAKVIEALDKEQDKSWLPAPREYQLQTPGAK